MAYEQRPNSGSLFINDRKQTDRHPDYTGTAMVNGTEVYISGWKKTTNTGKTFLSLAFKAKNGQSHDVHAEPVDSTPF